MEAQGLASERRMPSLGASVGAGAGVCVKVGSASASGGAWEPTTCRPFLYSKARTQPYCAVRFTSTCSRFIGHRRLRG